ncbi:hypothetical protein EVAR_66191_1 [Eumeta japonica]|uniref:Gustatory receptor n=1 Tax=Eumeta variegata TaxID=151549 RepID=A0A4C1ZRL6_EUMVA|nr:hypothetical protein EVAR_66191_1 [Eumeta japonica]
MPKIYKIISKIILDQISTTQDENQPIEQAGFRKNFATIDHTHTVKQIVEKSVPKRRKEEKRKEQRRRCEDKLKLTAGPNWRRVARDRKQWKIQQTSKKDYTPVFKELFISCRAPLPSLDPSTGTMDSSYYANTLSTSMLPLKVDDYKVNFPSAGGYSGLYEMTLINAEAKILSFRRMGENIQKGCRLHPEEPEDTCRGGTLPYKSLRFAVDEDEVIEEVDGEIVCQTLKTVEYSYDVLCNCCFKVNEVFGVSIHIAANLAVAQKWDWTGEISHSHRREVLSSCDTVSLNVNLLQFWLSLRADCVSREQRDRCTELHALSTLARLNSHLCRDNDSLEALTEARNVLHVVSAGQPRLSACGLFELRMSLITGFLSLTATYSIVLLQFTHFL